MTPHRVPNSAPPTGPVISPGIGEMITWMAWIAMNTIGAAQPHDETVCLRKCLSRYRRTRNRIDGASMTTSQITIVSRAARIRDARAGDVTTRSLTRRERRNSDGGREQQVESGEEGVDLRPVHFDALVGEHVVPGAHTGAAPDEADERRIEMFLRLGKLIRPVRV